MRGREPGQLAEPALGRLLEDTIRDAENPSRHQAHPGSCRSSRTAEPNPPALTFSSTVTIAPQRARQLQDEPLVERLDEAGVDDRRRDALGGKQIGGALGGQHHRAEGEDRDV